MFKTIHSKFIVFTIVFILLSVGIPASFLILQFRENFEQRSRVMLEMTLDTFMAGLYNMMMGGIDKDVQHIVEKISLNRSVGHIRVFELSGNILYSTDTSEVNKNLKIVGPIHLVEPLDQKRIFRIEDQDIYSMTAPIENRAQCQSCHGNQSIIAYLDIDTDFTQAEINFYTGSVHIVFLAIAVILILFFGFYFLFNHFINKPLSKFILAFDEVEKGNLSLQLAVEKQDEFGLLENHFNRMIFKLYKSQETIEEFHTEQLRRADKLVTLGELTAEMAHEIINPAGIIMTRADYLQVEIQKIPETQRYANDLAVIIDQINRISKITHNILKYGKKLPKEFQNFNLIEVVEEGLSILEPRFLKNKITLIKHFDSETCNILGDPQQIEQVLINLINNAIDAMSNSGELTVSIQNKPGQKCQVLIKDTGKGIDEHSMEQIYSPFFTTKSPDKGTGLGLYIVRNICKNHNAEITCRSKIEEGTVFTIIFNDN